VLRRSHLILITSSPQSQNRGAPGTAAGPVSWVGRLARESGVCAGVRRLPRRTARGYEAYTCPSRRQGLRDPTAPAPANQEMVSCPSTRRAPQTLRDDEVLPYGKANMAQKSPRCIGHLGDFAIGWVYYLGIGQVSYTLPSPLTLPTWPTWPVRCGGPSKWPPPDWKHPVWTVCCSRELWPSSG